jgi:ribosome recycling factor
VIDDIIKDAEERMNKAVAAVRHEFTTVRTGRASAAILDRVVVEYYGTPTPLQQLGNITAPEAQLLVIHPYDKTQIAAMEKALLASDVGLTPSNDGNVIRLPFPAPTEERRRELVKLVHKMGEDGKIAVRNIRRDANEHLKGQEKNHEFSKDDLERAEQRTQKLTDQYTAEVDTMVKTKEKEIMEV